VKAALWRRHPELAPPGAVILMTIAGFGANGVGSHSAATADRRMPEAGSREGIRLRTRRRSASGGQSDAQEGDLL